MKKEMFRNFLKDRKTNYIFCMLQGGKEEQNVDKWKDSFTGFLSFFLSLVISLLSVLSFRAFVSSTIPIGCQSTEISTIAPHSWLWLEKVPFTWQHLDILKLHFIFLQGDLFWKTGNLCFENTFSLNRKDSVSNNTPQKLIISAVKYKFRAEWWFWE